MAHTCGKGMKRDSEAVLRESAIQWVMLGRSLISQTIWYVVLARQ